jgi:glycerol-3-phosphate acyltransferase PlsY
LAALFLTYTHRSNLARLRAGTEPRFERARFIGRWLPKPRA